MAGERRKDYMVSKRVHLLYMLTWITSLALVGSLVAMAYTLRGASRALPEASQTSFIAVGALAFVIVCSALLLAVYTIVHTHRLMGSAYRIGVCLREINAGQPTRINLRDGDFFLEIADEINLLADTASKGHQGSKSALAKAEPASEAKAEPAPEGKAEPAPEAKAEPAPEVKAEPAPEAKAEPASGGDVKTEPDDTSKPE